MWILLKDFLLVSMGMGIGAVSYTHLDVYKRQVYIKELSAPAGYKVDKTVYSLKIEAGKTATLNVSDTPKVTDTLIELFKIDMETQKDNPQGNACLLYTSLCNKSRL